MPFDDVWQIKCSLFFIVRLSNKDMNEVNENLLS